MIYLDYQATTPVAPEVAQAMEPWIEEKFANPHSPSRWGHEAAAAIEVARKQVEKAIDLRGGSVAFTGSATEALNWALKGTVEKAPKGRNRIITVATEHAAVLDTCEWLAGQGVDLAILPVDREGRVDLDLLERELDERVLIVSVMMVNNEIGVRQPLTAISEMAHKVGAFVLSDAVQALGRRVFARVVLRQIEARHARVRNAEPGVPAGEVATVEQGNSQNRGLDHQNERREHRRPSAHRLIPSRAAG